MRFREGPAYHGGALAPRVNKSQRRLAQAPTDGAPPLSTPDLHFLRGIVRTWTALGISDAGARAASIVHAATTLADPRRLDR